MKKMLVVIDFQNDFVNGSLGFPGAELLDAPLAARIREYEIGEVFFTLDTHKPDYLKTREGIRLPVEHCIENTPGRELFGETKKALEERKAVGFFKNRFGLLITPEIEARLPKDPEEIELAGLVSNICVLSNAVIFQTLYPEANIKVDAKLTASADPVLHEKALDVMEGLQITVFNR